MFLFTASCLLFLLSYSSLNVSHLLFEKKKESFIIHNLYFLHTNHKKFLKAEVNEILRQELLIQLWDYDGYFPGVQGDDPLGESVQTCEKMFFFSFFFFEANKITCLLCSRA